MDGPRIKKLYYSTQEVIDLTNVPLHTLRKWEETFSSLQPVKRKTGRKVYREHDLHVVLSIKRLKQAGYSDNEIRNLFHNASLGKIVDINHQSHPLYGKELFKEVRSNLKEILNLLEKS